MFTAGLILTQWVPKSFIEIPWCGPCCVIFARHNSIIPSISGKVHSPACMQKKKGQTSLILIARFANWQLSSKKLLNKG